MKLSRRRLTFQLAPLLDLLLIVIFAQYMEVRQQTVAAGDEASRKLAAAEQQIAHANRALAAERETSDAWRELQERLDESDREKAQLSEQARQLQQQTVALEQSLEQAAAQRDLVGRLATELFKLPDDLIDQQLLSKDPDVLKKSPEQLDALREKFRQLGQQQASDMVKHLLTYEELRKRCDIWDLYIDENGNVLFEAGEQAHRFRAETAEAFATRLFESYKSLPEPKSLVIILLSYGNTRAVWRKAARDGLREAATRMRADAGGQTRFEYAVLGYRPRRSTIPDSK